jgi:hypothetical protein
LEVQRRCIELLAQVAGGDLAPGPTAAWLIRPGRDECGIRWPLVQEIYRALTRRELPDVMPPRERRTIDAVLTHLDGSRRLVEIDEKQHFTPARANVLEHYPSDLVTGFDAVTWAERSRTATRLPGGGFARPCPPLFPDSGGRHLQRAFRDGLADLLPSVHGWRPTLRIADFEVVDWLHAEDAEKRMAALVGARLAT